MKRIIKIIGISSYNNKILLRRNSKDQSFGLPTIELSSQIAIEESLGAHFQNKIGVIPIQTEIFDVNILGTDLDSDVALVYKLKLSEIDYKQTLKNNKLLWIDHNGSDVVIDKLTQKILNVLKDKKMLLPEPDNVQIASPHNLYTDGSSRGNPGPSAYGYLITDNFGQMMKEGYGYLGVTTSLIAEYQAVIEGLSAASEMKLNRLIVHVDNLAIANHLNGKHDITNRELWPIYERVSTAMANFDSVIIKHVNREFNQVADSLANKALDEYLIKNKKSV